MVLLLFRLEEGIGGAEGARRARYNEDAFRVNVRENAWKNGVSTVIIVPECVDSIAVLGGHPNLTAVGPEAWRHYSRAFNLCAKGPREVRGSSISVNPKDVALLACYDHVKAKCAKMVERNPVVVRCEAPLERYKQRDIPAFGQGSGETRRRSRPQRPDALRGELLLRKNLRGMPRNASGMPRNFNSHAERGQIQYNHNKSKQIHSHRQSDCGVHCQNAKQPKESGLLGPNENWVTDLDQAD